MDKLNFIKIKNFQSEKDSINKIRSWSWATDWERRFAKDTPDKGLLSKNIQELLKLNNKVTKSLVRKQAEDFYYLFI